MKKLILPIFLCLMSVAVSADEVVISEMIAEKPSYSAEERRNLKTLQQWFDIWNEGKYELLETTIAPIYTRHDPTTNRTVTREQYIAEVKAWRTNHKMRYQFHLVSADKDLVWEVWSVKTTDPKTGEDKFGKSVQVYRLEDGLIVETWWTGGPYNGAWPEAAQGTWPE